MSELRTAFEQRGRTAPWTSLVDGDAYMDALLSQVPAIREEIVGASVGGKPMRLFKLGTGPKHVYILCQQHGSELSGREAAFTLLREWAQSTDPNMVDYLTKVTLLVMPTAHPDNIVARNNANGVDTNRDQIKLSQPETRAMQTVIRDYNPDLIFDVHEGANITNHYATGPALNGNMIPELSDMSVDLETVVKTAIEGQGYTWERYQGSRAMIGAENFNNNVGVRNHLSLLLESRRTYGDDSDAAERHTTQMIALNSLITWHQQHLDDVSNTVAAARSSIISRTNPIQLMTGTLPYNGPIIDPLPTGYLLTDDQHEEIHINRDLFQITSIQVMEGWFIPTGQMAQNVISYLVDEDSPEKVVSGVRDFRQEIIPYDPPEPAVVDLSDIIGYKFNFEGTIMDATLHVGGA